MHHAPSTILAVAAALAIGGMIAACAAGNEPQARVDGATYAERAAALVSYCAAARPRNEKSLMVGFSRPRSRVPMPAARPGRNSNASPPK